MPRLVVERVGLMLVGFIAATVCTEAAAAVDLAASSARLIHRGRRTLDTCAQGQTPFLSNCGSPNNACLKGGTCCCDGGLYVSRSGCNFCCKDPADVGCNVRSHWPSGPTLEYGCYKVCPSVPVATPTTPASGTTPSCDSGCQNNRQSDLDHARTATWLALQSTTNYNNNMNAIRASNPWSGTGGK